VTKNVYVLHTTERLDVTTLRKTLKMKSAWPIE